MKTDVIVIGGGIAGAATACFASAAGSVTVLEQEARFGFHSSGRTAGQYTVGIASDTMRALAAASRPFLQAPPDGFCDTPLLTARRGNLTVGRAPRREALERLHRRIRDAGGQAEWLGRDGALALFPALRPDRFDMAVHEADAADIDVNALLTAYLRRARRNGAQVVPNGRVTAIRREGSCWRVETAGASWLAPVVVNAAGGWADGVAAMAGVAPLGVVAHKRTAFTFAKVPDVDSGGWPHMSGVDGGWYVKPERGCFMGSPADALPVDPADVHAEIEDVARGAFHIGRETTLVVGRPTGTWAGLRSYVADRHPVCGARTGDHGFFWVAGQGGCGILCSPALGRAVAALIQGQDVPPDLRRHGLTRAALSPDRPGLAAARA